MASPALISQQQQPVVQKSALSYAKIVLQQDNCTENGKPIEKGNISNNKSADLQQQISTTTTTTVVVAATTAATGNMKNKPVVVGRGRRGSDHPPSIPKQYHNGGGYSSSDRVVVRKNVQEERSRRTDPEPSSLSQQQQQISPTQDIPDQDDANGEFETVVGKRHGHSSMKFRDNNNVVSGRGKYNHNNYRRYRRPFHENRNNIADEKSIAPSHLQKVVTNGSICSETSSNSSTDGHVASIISDENGQASASNSTENSSGENDADNGEPKVKYVDAPPPKVNPWQVNSNASSVIAKVVKPAPEVVKNPERPVVNGVAGRQTFADSVLHQPDPNKFKGARSAFGTPIEKVSVTVAEEDWPALDEAVHSAPPLHKSSATMDVKSVRISSNATQTTESGEETSAQSHGNQLSQEKWPSISAASNSNAGLEPKNLEELTSTVITVEIDTINEATTQGASSRDGDISGEEPTSDEIANRKKNTKSGRLKWVPLNLPENETTTNSKPPRRDRPVDKSAPKFRHTENSDSHNGRGVGRGRGRGSSSMGTRGGRGGIRNGARYNNNHQSFHKEPYDHNNISRQGNDRDDYTDYPTDFTTLYPLSDFIMPYVTQFVPPTFVTSPLADSKPITECTIGQDKILIDLVKKQIEYYFSEENLGKDFYLRRKMDSDGYLPVRLISSFHRVRNMTQDYGLVLTAIRSSNDLELRPDMSSVRTVHDPTKWPILDSAMPFPSIHPTLMMPMCSGILIPLPTNVIMNNNNYYNGSSSGGDRLPSESVELLNPNVPEFVPKSYFATSDLDQREIITRQQAEKSTYYDDISNDSTINVGNGDRT